jgi:hypothetical protein
MTQTVTTISSTSVSPIIPTGELLRTVDNAILTTDWSVPIAVIDTSTFTATPINTGTPATMLVQFSADVGAPITWTSASDIAYRVTTTEGVPPTALWIRAMATGATSTLTVYTPITAYVLTSGGTIGVQAAEATASRALVADDFADKVLSINSAGVVALTVPTVALLGLSATPGCLRVAAFQVTGAGIPTFAGATAATTINGTAGTSTVLPLGGAPVQYGHYTLTQLAVGGNDWSLE